jgi:aspartyl-tRNA(Asn)/glutamyl-tRNA(Gln) amidotransferase subunit C
MIDSNTLNHLAQLARLTVPDEEKEQLAKDITNIVGFIDTIQKVTIPEIGDKNFTQKNVAREDIALPLSSVYDLVEAAPLHKDDFVQVPKVIGE